VLIDTSGLLALAMLHDRLREVGKQLVLCGASVEVDRLLFDARLIEALGRDNVQPDLVHALRRAEALLEQG
jgi:SulP family sulfate permease